MKNVIYNLTDGSIVAFENESMIFSGLADTLGIYKCECIGTETNISQLANQPSDVLLQQSVFGKLQIRRAMRALGNEDVLNSLLTNSKFADDWYDAPGSIDLNDALVIEALATVKVDIVAIKKQILGIS